MVAEYSVLTGVHLAKILGKENVPLQRGVHSNYVEDNGKTHQRSLSSRNYALTGIILATADFTLDFERLVLGCHSIAVQNCTERT